MLTLSSSHLEIIAKSWQGKPSEDPLAMSICCGHPQPQKLNCSRAPLSCGLPALRLRNVLSNGIVTDDWFDLRVTVFLPFFTV